MEEKKVKLEISVNIRISEFQKSILLSKGIYLMILQNLRRECILRYCQELGIQTWKAGSTYITYDPETASLFLYSLARDGYRYRVPRRNVIFLDGREGPSFDREKDDIVEVSCYTHEYHDDTLKYHMRNIIDYSMQCTDKFFDSFDVYIDYDKDKI